MRSGIEFVDTAKQWDGGVGSNSSSFEATVP